MEKSSPTFRDAALAKTRQLHLVIVHKNILKYLNYVKIIKKNQKNICMDLKCVVSELDLATSNSLIEKATPQTNV